MSQKKMEVDETRSLRDWADYFNVPFSSFKRWASNLGKRSPYFRSDARIIAFYGLKKAERSKGAARQSGERNIEYLQWRLKSNE